jgi:hypothetical protein
VYAWNFLIILLKIQGALFLPHNALRLLKVVVVVMIDREIIEYQVFVRSICRGQMTKEGVTENLIEQLFSGNLYSIGMSCLLLPLVK